MTSPTISHGSIVGSYALSWAELTHNLSSALIEVEMVGFVNLCTRARLCQGGQGIASKDRQDESRVYVSA